MHEPERADGFHLLDEDEPRPARQPVRWEVVLGGLLLAVLVAVGGWQWWSAQARLDAYQVGARAAAAEDWARAQAAYQAAGGYADAAARAAQSARLEIYSAALSGTVAARPESRPAGLYSYGAGGWHWLEPSDAQSRVLGRCPNGDLLFDGAWVTAGPTPTPEPGRLPQRRLFVGTARGPLRAALAIDAAQYVWFICTASGVWAGWTTDELASLGDSHGAAPALNVVYQGLAEPEPAHPLLPGASWFVSGLVPAAGTLLAGDRANAGADGWSPLLYLADRTGGIIRPLGRLPGQPGPPVLGAAGPWSVVTAYRPIAGSRDFTNTVLLLDPSGARAPQVIADVRVAADVFEDHFQIAAQVLERGPRAGQVLLSWPDGDHTVIRLVDAARGTPRSQDFRTPAGFYGVRLFDSGAPDGALVFVATAPRPDGGGQMALLVIDAANRLRMLIPPLRGDGGPLSAWLRDGYLVYTTGVYTPSARDHEGHYTLWTVPETDLENPGALRAIYSGRFKLDWPPAGWPWHLGAGWLALLTPDGDVRAFSLDGTRNVLLDPGLLALFPMP